ncbi:MAG: hypothetical protein A2286_14365 [Gammaproteobacteria bacterium RIFOXYA12_FULL_61_12]|nr:MAG: hypothetical protein A2286_14365 [Gammaproteobacteria bacterium RIFOXYA12_FULL_61_12]OGT89642.1 MAG: hypothetical protein A2514_14705 [Gammaproteobacteria bacterium RIFOXYD12_FULL_61_37]
MKKLMISLALSALTLTAFAAEEAKPNSISVNGKPVSQQMLRHLMTQRLQPGKAPSEEDKQRLINEMVNMILLSQEATNNKLDQDKDHAAALEMERISYLANAALQEKLKGAKIEEPAMQALYKEKFASATKEFKASHILVKTEKEATDILAELNKGGDFAALAKKHSLDSTGQQGGDLGWFSADRMVKPFGDAVQAMKKGELSAKPVQTQFGWHLIKMEESRDTPPRSFEEAKPELMALLRQKAVQDYIVDLRKKAEIKSVNLPE